MGSRGRRASMTLPIKWAIGGVKQYGPGVAVRRWQMRKLRCPEALARVDPRLVALTPSIQYWATTFPATFARAKGRP